MNAEDAAAAVTDAAGKNDKPRLRTYRCDKCGAQVPSDRDVGGTPHRFEQPPPSIKRIDERGVITSEDDVKVGVTLVDCGTWVEWESQAGCSAAEFAARK